MAWPKAGPEGCCCAHAHPREFRDDVVRVARRREPGVTKEPITEDWTAPGSAEGHERFLASNSALDVEPEEAHTRIS